VSLLPYRTALSVSNVNEISSWYQTVLGFQFARRVDFDEYGVHVIFLESDGFGLELIEKRGSASKKERMPDLGDVSLLHGFMKFAFLVENIDEFADALKAKDVKIIHDVTDDPEDLSTWMIVADPDGNLIQFFENTKQPAS